MTGRTEGIKLIAGQTHFWNVGMIPEQEEPTTSPSEGPTRAPTVKPSLLPTTAEPTVLGAPSAGPTALSAPTPCVVMDKVEESIMGMGPIARATFGSLFLVFTPDKDALLFDDDGKVSYIQIMLLSLRALNPISTPEVLP